MNLTIRRALLVLTLGASLSAFAATDDDDDAPPAIPAPVETPASANPGPMRHVITPADHDAAVKAQEAREQGATPAPSTPRVEEDLAPVAAPAPAPIAKKSPAKAAPKAKKAKASKHLASARRATSKKKLLAKKG